MSPSTRKRHHPRHRPSCHTIHPTYTSHTSHPALLLMHLMLHRHTHASHTPHRAHAQASVRLGLVRSGSSLLLLLLRLRRSGIRGVVIIVVGSVGVA